MALLLLLQEDVLVGSELVTVEKEVEEEELS